MSAGSQVFQWAYLIVLGVAVVSLATRRSVAASQLGISNMRRARVDLEFIGIPIAVCLLPFACLDAWLDSRTFTTALVAQLGGFLALGTKMAALAFLALRSSDSASMRVTLLLLLAWVVPSQIGADSVLAWFLDPRSAGRIRGGAVLDAVEVVRMLSSSSAILLLGLLEAGRAPLR